MIKPIIEFCVSNIADGSHEAFVMLEKDYDLDVIEYGCLGYCGKCSYHMFALVNGEIVKAETAKELVANIYKFLDENPQG
ncbi:YuzB family protein [Cytobacillus horneckiae]|uniref:YuzB family protein n=1 Tax=Cytobacillus horneckiae TaxID=549687 RepID=UPI00203A5019|nr:YuzB family protein [Cytobacillus horneckiae]MCM3180739.1 YuzB family protein [Cytobacillus horneckiae]